MSDFTVHYVDFCCGPEWVGNFQREFIAYVFGAMEEYLSTDSAFLTNDPVVEQTFDIEFLDFFNHDEYGLVLSDVNRVQDPVTGETVNSIRVRIGDDTWKNKVTSETITVMKERAVSFFTFYKDNARFVSDNIKKSTCTQVVHTVAVTTEKSENL